MAKYRKKPVEVEAFQYDGDFINSKGESYVPKWAIDALNGFTLQIGSFDFKDDPAGLYIRTLEGTMRIDIGDFIIQGVNGELYPCKPDIFEKTYEKVEYVHCSDCAVHNMPAMPNGECNCRKCDKS
ncbi:MAG: hypothetical protein ACRC7I_13260 [Selenomonadaceae bacterium]